MSTTNLIKKTDEEITKYEKPEKSEKKNPESLSLETKSKYLEGIERSTNKLNEAFSRLEKVEKQLNLVPERKDKEGRRDSGSSAGNAVLLEFDELVGAVFPGMVKRAFWIEVLLEEQIDKLYTALSATRSLMALSIECKRAQDWDTLCSPIAKLIAEIVEISEKNRSSPYYEILSFVSKAAPCLAWIASATPANHIQQFRAPTDAVISKFVKDYKWRENFVTFAETFGEFWKGLETYVQKNHPNGLVWSQNGRDPPHLLKYPKRGYPFAQAKGTTPKSRYDSTSGKWFCENLTGSKILEIEKKQTFYLRDCENAHIHFKGKGTAITIDSCSFSKITVDATSILNITNCFSLTVVCSGPILSITISKTHRCTLKYSDKSESAQITTNGVTNLMIQDSDGPNEMSGVIRGKINRGKLIVL